MLGVDSQFHNKYYAYTDILEDRSTCTMSTKIEYPHPSLGLVRALTSGSTIQFLGVPYATLETKWSPPVLSDPLTGTILDATNSG